MTLKKLFKFLTLSDKAQTMEFIFLERGTFDVKILLNSVNIVVVGVKHYTVQTESRYGYDRLDI